MDGLRAMREARHAEMVARSKTARTTANDGTSLGASADKKAPGTKGPVTVTSTGGASGESASPPEPVVEALCGHRNMSGRTCTREQGHAAKSHRYS